MIVTMIIVCEVAFWVLLAAGLGLRYVARMPRTGAAVLLCEPLLELVLLVITAVDLKNGAEPDFKHGLAAVYIGFTATHGHYMVKWADGHVAHRFAGGPRPVKPPRYGMARAVHEWKMGARAIGGAAIAAALLQLAIWYVGDPSQSESLLGWQQRMGVVAGISLLIAVSYTVFPKRDKHGGRDEHGQHREHSEHGEHGGPGPSGAFDRAPHHERTPEAGAGAGRSKGL